MALTEILNTDYHYLARITKANKDFAKKVDFKHIKFPVKTKDIHKIGIKNSIGVSAFVDE